MNEVTEMAMITEYAVTDAAQWNGIVRSFADYDVFYLNEYVTASFKHRELTTCCSRAL